MGRVELIGLSKVFPPGIRAVVDLTLTIEEGEFVTLLGPSGCGKTTTLRLIAGFEEPSSGRILINGRDVTHLPPHRRDTGMVFQSLALFPHMNVFENIAYSMRIRKQPREEIRRRVLELLRMVRLEGLEHRRIQQLSGGQQQRVAVARALAMNPSIFLLDEPFAALDKNLREEMQIELRRLQRRIGITTIFVTHNQREAMSMSDRIVVMNAGVIEQVGTPQEIYLNPASAFVARFIGTANLMEAVVESVDDLKLIVRTQDGPVEVRRHPGHPPARSPCYLLVRPEGVRLQRETTETGPNRLRGRIDFKRHVGELMEYYIKTSSGQEIISAYQTGSEEFFEGEEVLLIIDPLTPRVLHRED